MNVKYITLLLTVFSFCVLFSSCNDNDSTTNYGASSKDAQIYSFSLTAPVPISKDSVIRAQDSIRYIQVNKTNYAIDQVRGVIYNPDSMPFGVKLNKALVTATFNSYYGINRMLVITPDSLNGYPWNTKDSIDFSKGGVKFKVYAADGMTYKDYDIDVRIHKVNPNLIPWYPATSLPQAGSSKTLLNKHDAFFTYTVNGGVVTLDTMKRSDSAWKKISTLGLPATVKTESIFIANDVFYAIDKSGSSYSSTDGITWVNKNNGKTIESILGVIPTSTTAGYLLVILKENGTFKYGKGKDLNSIEYVTNVNSFPDTAIPSNFPISDMASYTNYSSNSTDRMLMLTGGLNGSNKISATWLIKNAKDGLEITFFEEKALFEGGAGLSNFMYNNLYYVMDSNQFYTSDNWGNKWANAPDEQELGDKATIRSKQTVIVDSQNYIWIFGGVSKQGTYLTEVWKGRLNQLN